MHMPVFIVIYVVQSVSLQDYLKYLKNAGANFVLALNCQKRVNALTYTFSASIQCIEYYLLYVLCWVCHYPDTFIPSVCLIFLLKLM